MMRTHKLNKLSILVWLLLVIGNTGQGQELTLNSFVSELSRSQSIYTVDSLIWNDVITQINDSCHQKFHCVPSVLYKGVIIQVDNDSVLNLTALNVWTDSTYIHHLNTENKLEILVINGLIVMCSLQMIENLRNMFNVVEKTRFLQLVKEEKCMSRVDSGIYYRIKLEADKPSLLHFGTLRFRN